MGSCQLPCSVEGGGCRQATCCRWVAGCGWTYRAIRNRDANMNSFRASLIVLTFLSFAGFTAVAQPEEKSSAPLKAVAVLHPTGGNKVSGTVTFTEVADGVQVQAE